MTGTLADAIAHALHDSSVTLATHVPGFGAIQTFDAFSRLSQTRFATSFHEEAAFGVAHGAAIAGMRSAVVIKSHGLAKAMNAVMDSLSAGVTAAMLVLVFEDPSGTHSDNIIDIQPIVKGSGIPYRIANADTAYRDIVESVAASERLELPHVVIFNADEISTTAKWQATAGSAVPTYTRNVTQRLVVPVFASYQDEVLSAKLDDEDWRAIPQPQIPLIPEGLPADYQRAVTPYLPLFTIFRETFADTPNLFVAGDTGVSTLSALAPYHIVHATTYMGGSIPLATGAALAGFTNAWAFTGDFSFIAAGQYGLIECQLRNIPLRVVIFVNNRAQTTGGQPIEAGMLERVLGGYEEHLIRLDRPNDPALTKRVLTEASQSDRLSIILAQF